MANLTVIGDARSSSGDPAIEVVLFVWRLDQWSNEIRVTPDALGAWSAVVPPGRYGVIFFFAHCAPEAHGPYLFSAT
jgi:hypothetical protein